jgi:ribosomal protein L19
LSAAAQHPLYPTWQGMCRRCSDPRHVAYHRYGGRGITVCERWKENFWAFVADIGDRPAGRTLNRIDNDGNYEPGNCNWATQKEQSANQSCKRVLTFNGLTLTITQWAQKTGLTAFALRKRIRNGWSVERTLTEPLKTSSPELMRLAASRAGKVSASKRYGSVPCCAAAGVPS